MEVNSVVKSARLKKPHVLKDQSKTELPAGANMLTGDIFRIHLGRIAKAKAAVEAAKKPLKAARREAQDAGINLRDLDEMIAMREQEPETVKDTILRKATYASWMGLAPGVKQGDLFAHADEEEDATKAAENEGYYDALEGNKNTGDRYDTTNPIGKARMKGFHKGVERLGRFMEDRKEALKAKAAEEKAKAKPRAKVKETEQEDEAEGATVN
jgi:hypothetical protein